MSHFLRYIKLNIKGIRRLTKLAMFYMPFIMRPEQIQIDITDRCNYRCPTCSKWHQKSSKNELTTDQWKKFLIASANLPFSKRVVFGGGEPLLRPDLLELVHHASKLKLKTIIISNGSLLTMPRLKQLQDAGLDYLMVSLNALNADVHNETRGTRGSFNHIMRLIEDYSLLKNTMHMGLSSIIMKNNMDQLLPLVRFVMEHKLHGIMFQTYMDDAVHHPFQGKYQKFRDIEWYKTNKYLIDNCNRLDKIIDTLLHQQLQGVNILNPPHQLRAMKAYYRNPIQYDKIPCVAGTTGFIVDAYGNVRICFGLPPLGNILYQDPLKIWKSTKAMHIRKQVNICQRSCRIMNHIY
jgi:hypothetical protein